MNETNFPDPSRPHPTMHGRPGPILTEAGLVLAGMLIIGLTLHNYPNFETHFPIPSHTTISLAEADRQIASAKTYLTTHPDDFDTYVALAMLYFQKGPDHYVESLNAQEKARALGATDDHLFFYAGIMYDTLGLPDYAINEFSKYLRHHPHDYETMIRLANLDFHQKRYDDAELLYRAALSEWPKDVTAWFNYAVIQKEKGNYAEALSHLEHIERVSGHLPEGGDYLKGEIYRLQGDAQRALQFYQQELALQPDYLPALEATEAILRAQGDRKKSRELRRRITDLKRSNGRNAMAVVGAAPSNTSPATIVAPAAPISSSTTVAEPSSTANRPRRMRKRVVPAAAATTPTPAAALPVINSTPTTANEKSVPSESTKETAISTVPVPLNATTTQINP